MERITIKKLVLWIWEKKTSIIWDMNHSNDNAGRVLKLKPSPKNTGAPVGDDHQLSFSLELRHWSMVPSWTVAGNPLGIQPKMGPWALSDRGKLWTKNLKIQGVIIIIHHLHSFSLHTLPHCHFAGALHFWGAGKKKSPHALPSQASFRTSAGEVRLKCRNGQQFHQHIPIKIDRLMVDS